MFHIVIICLILMGLVLHRYLTNFYEQGTLPYSAGFLFFANAFALIYFVGFVWMFGIIAGTVVALLCFLQIVYSSGLWIFSLPWLISMHKSIDNFEVPTVSPLVYGSFSFLVMFIAVLVGIDIYASSYKSVWELIGNNVWEVIIVLLGIVLIGNLVRMAVMSKFINK